MASRLRMALVPQGAGLIENSTGGPPGFFIGNVYVMAGIPTVMRAMLASLEFKLQGGAVIQSRSITVYLGESAIAEPLRQLQADYPDVDIGSYPFNRDGRYGTTLVMRSTNAQLLGEVKAKLAALIVAAGAEPEEEQGEE
jgi:molybdopterin-biosynthesis enzyme MoeA-like protein